MRNVAELLIGVFILLVGLTLFSFLMLESDGFVDRAEDFEGA